MGTQTSPRPYLTIMLMASVVTFSAAMRKSPSFSRSSSSATITMRPCLISSIADSMLSNIMSSAIAERLVILLIGVDVGNSAFLEACFDAAVDFGQYAVIINSSYLGNHSAGSNNFITLLNVVNHLLNLFLALTLRANNEKIENEKDGSQKNKVHPSGLVRRSHQEKCCIKHVILIYLK